MKIFSNQPMLKMQNANQAKKANVATLSVLKSDTVNFGNVSPEMKLERTRSLYKKARTEGYAIPAYNFNNLEQLHAAISAANAKKSPVIVQVSAGARKYAKPDYLIKMLEAAKKEAKVPVMLHLDHGEDFEVCKACVDAGFDSVMIDASKHPLEENIEITKKVVEYAHSKGVFVEAELGKLAGVEDNISSKESKFTDPEEAARFVKETGCDSLAISIGTSHGPVKFRDDEKPELDFARLEQIDKAVEKATGNKKYPFVLHGASSAPKDLVDKANEFVVIPRKLLNAVVSTITSMNSLVTQGVSSPESVENRQSIIDELNVFGKPIKGKGVPEEMYTEATKLGIAKVNVDSDFRLAVTGAIKKNMAENPTNIDPRKYLGEARSASQVIGERKIDVLESAEKA